MHLYLKLTLRRYAVEASATCTALHRHYSQAIARILANSLESGQSICINQRLKLKSTCAEILFLCFRFAHNICKLRTLFREYVLAISKILLSTGNVSLLGFTRFLILSYVLLGKLNLQTLKLYFLVQEIKFPVVAHIVLLLLVAGNLRLTVIDLTSLRSNLLLKLSDLFIILFDTSIITGDIILKIFHFIGELATQNLDTVDF